MPEEQQTRLIGWVETMICAYREQDRKLYPDSPIHEQAPTWKTRANGEKACSYCGSMEASEFYAFMERVIDDPSPYIRIELNDHRDKIYVTRPEVKNADDGPLYIRTVHLPLPPTEEDARYRAMFRAANRVSRGKFKRFMDEEFPKILEESRRSE